MSQFKKCIVFATVIFVAITGIAATEPSYIDLFQSSTGLRYALTETPEGRAFLESLLPDLPLEKQFEKATIRAANTEALKKRFISLSLSHFYQPKEFKEKGLLNLDVNSPEVQKVWQAPITELDQISLRHATQEHLAYKSVPSPKRVQASLTEAWVDTLSDHQWSQWLEWDDAARDSGLPTEIRSIRLYEEASAQLNRNRWLVEPSQFQGAPSFTLLPNDETQVGKIATGLKRCFGTALYYCPEYLVEEDVRGAYSKVYNTLLAPHSLLSGDTHSETMVHEILHTFLGNELAEKRVNLFHGLVKVENVTSQTASHFNYANARMNFEEVGAMAMSLRRAAQRLLGQSEADPDIVGRIRWYAKQGELASAYAEWASLRALEAFERNPSKLTFETKPKNFVNGVLTSIRFEREGKSYQLSLPLVLSEKEMSQIRSRPQEFEDVVFSHFRKQLADRALYFKELQAEFAPVTELTTHGHFNTAEKVRHLQDLAYKPRTATTYELYRQRSAPCTLKNLVPHLNPPLE